MNGYSGITDLHQFLTQLGESIAKSNLFGCQNVEQGYVLAMECVSRRMPPMQIAERYHLIHGKMSKKAEAMLAEFRENGGTHTVIQRDADRVEIELTDEGGARSQTFSLTWAECAEEPFVYAGREDDNVSKLAAGEAERKKLKLKAKYATPRSRTQMMWARVVSDAVRAFAPEIVAGAYSPEEIRDFAGPPAENLPMAAAPAPRIAAPAPVDRPENHGYLDGLDGKANAQQIADITECYIRLQVPADKQQALLTKRGARSLEGLTQEQAADLLIALEGIEKQAAAANDDGATGESVDGLPQELQLVTLRKKLKETSEEIREEVKKQMNARGLKLETLSAGEVSSLIEHISLGEIAEFF